MKLQRLCLTGAALILLISGCRTTGGTRISAPERTVATAAARGDLELLNTLIAEGSDVREADAAGHTPLTRACMAGRADSVGVLLKAGAHPDGERRPGITPLLIATVNSYHEIADQLLAAGADVRLLDLNYVARWGDAKTVLRMLQAGADPAVQILPAPPALVTACRNDQQPLILALLDKGGDPQMHDETGETLLSIACGAGNLPLAKLLITRGAHPDLPDRDGSFPLIRAAQTGNLGLVNLLLDNGADINRVDRNSATAAFGATLQDDPDMLRLLIRRGADLSIASAWGTPPEYAAKERKDLATHLFKTENSETAP